MITNEQWLENRDINVTPYVYQKQGMDYIPWGDMEVLLRMNVKELPSWKSWVENGIVFVQFEGYQVYSLAISDFRNNAIENPDSTDVEDTRQRAFVKAAARTFGIGHRLYEKDTYRERASTPKEKKLAPMTGEPLEVIKKKGGLF